MGRSRYKIVDDELPHFVTLTVLHWIPVMRSHAGAWERENFGQAEAMFHQSADLAYTNQKVGGRTGNKIVRTHQ